MSALADFSTIFCFLLSQTTTHFQSSIYLQLAKQFPRQQGLKKKKKKHVSLRTAIEHLFILAIVSDILVGEEGPSVGLFQQVSFPAVEAAQQGCTEAWEGSMR